MQAHPRDPQARASAVTDDSRVLSVAEASDYIDRHFAAHIQGITHHPLVSERQVRRLLSTGVWPCTRTASGRLGITVGDLKAIWTPEGGRALAACRADRVHGSAMR